ncbi:hypothetical protein ACFXHA_43600 [Nocardia sp. NPDC059240]|uniref:hypothetical protein n=1 Tax=Nocardia sp. NPDC059240 TaxID=3346786 RepID=UPI0036CAB830
MTSTTPAVNLELVSRMPWLLPEPESIWCITGTYGHGRGQFRGILAMVAPFDTTDGHVLFIPIHPCLHEDPTSPFRCIAPNQISHAHRLVLVDAERPHLAYFLAEQDLVDCGREER